MKEIGFHRNIMSMLGYWVRSEPIMLILEYVPHGDLLQWLRNKRNQVRICFAFVFLRKSGDSFAFSSLIDGGINNCPTDEILWLLHKCCPCVVSWPSESLSTAFQPAFRFPKPLTFDQHSQQASSYYMKIEYQNVYFRLFLKEAGTPSTRISNTPTPENNESVCDIAR